jgi:hypothetical protein
MNVAVVRRKRRRDVSSKGFVEQSAPGRDREDRSPGRPPQHLVSTSRGVDNGTPGSLYTPSWRAAAWRDGASAKPLTVYAVNHPAMSLWLCRMCGLRRLPLAFPSLRWEVKTGARRSRKVPGCLKSESEERETWTAESLRAASSNGEGLGSLRMRAAMKRLRRSYVSRFSTLLAVQTVRRVGTSSNVVISRDQYSST